ncbi:hypothetical protein [Legionella rowbothamii]|uniref:hypothetical protein n=1 Tax=Legionella rowbothamii TaxID=96229 RepID=UPI001A93B2B9|nr:hypothetical protein [Legionella rowbothamii]
MMSITEKDYELAAECQGTLLYNESLAEYSPWRVGGPAYKLYKPANGADIGVLIHLVQTKVREQTTIELMREVHIIGDA